MTSKKQSVELKAVSSIKKTAKECCDILSKSGKTFEDIYNTVFFRSGVLCETSGASGFISYTYADFRSAVDRVSAALHEKVGCNRYVAIYGKNSFEWTVSFWAVLKSGNKPFLVNTLLPRKTLVSILDTLDCDFILCTDVESGLGKEDITYESLVKSEASEFFGAFANEIALSTSGTTLSEKICLYSGEVVSNQILNTPHIIKTTPSIQDTYNGKLKMLMVLPLYHIFGLEASYLWFLFLGAVFVFPPSLAPSVLLSTVKRHGVTHIFSVPLLWHEIDKSVRKEVASLDEKTRQKFEKAIETSLKLQKTNCSLGQYFAKKALKSVRNRLFGDSVKFCISGGAHIKAETLRLINALGYPLYNGYGMTEIGIISANFTDSIDRRLSASIGQPFRSIEAAKGENGHLTVKGDSICREMIINGERVSLDGSFDTGDIVSQNEFGDFEITGRASDLVINADGENLSPDIAQNSLSIESAIAFSVLGNEKNDELILVVQISKESLELRLDTVKTEVAEATNTLPSAYHIRNIYYTTDMIIEANEIKISRKKLRARIDRGEVRFIDEVSKKTFSSSSASPVAQKLREIFADVLDVSADEIDDHGHFMDDLGGTSLEYYDVVYRVEDHFEIKLDFQGENFGYTLSDFERIIKEKIDL